MLIDNSGNYFIVKSIKYKTYGKKQKFIYQKKILMSNNIRRYKKEYVALGILLFN